MRGGLMDVRQSLPSGYSADDSVHFFKSYQKGRWGKKGNHTLSPVLEHGGATSASVPKKTQSGPVVDDNPRIGFQPNISVQSPFDSDSQQGTSKSLPEVFKYPWAVPLSSLKVSVTRGSGASAVIEEKTSGISSAP
jgi:hypothetical protein